MTDTALTDNQNAYLTYVDMQREKYIQAWKLTSMTLNMFNSKVREDLRSQEVRNPLPEDYTLAAQRVLGRYL